MGSLRGSCPHRIISLLVSCAICPSLQLSPPSRRTQLKGLLPQTPNTPWPRQPTKKKKLMRAVSMSIYRGCAHDHQFLNDCSLHFQKAFRVVWVPRPTLDEYVQLPQTGPPMAIIRNTASSINPADWEPALTTPMYFEIPGIDSSGVIEEATPSCRLNYGLNPGDRVWTGQCNDGFAAFCAVHCSKIGRAPKSIDLVTAAAVPTAALTDLQALYKLGAPWTDKPKILITAAAGGCGLFAVQLAKHFGAGEVIATSSPTHFSMLYAMGADRVIDYHDRDWWDVLGPDSVDKIFDIVPLHPAAEHALDVLKDGGTYLQLAGGEIALFKNRFRARRKCRYIKAREDLNTNERCISVVRPDVSVVNFILSSWNTTDLDFLRDMIDGGKLNVTIDSVYSHTNVSSAFIRSEQTHTTGKMVMVHNFKKLKGAP